VSGLSRADRVALGLVALGTGLAALTRFSAATSALVAFLIAAVALAGQAYLVSRATEQIGERYGAALTGTLQATVGNLPEFFVVVFALQAGDTVVAQTALLGSILVNALLLLGLVLVVGSLSSAGGVMRFSARLPNDTATLLLVASFLIVLLALAHASGDVAAGHLQTITIVGAAVLLGVYLIWLGQYLRGGAGAEAGPAGTGGEAPAGATDDAPAAAPARRGPGAALGVLIAAGTASAFTSDWFIHALEPAIRHLHLSQAFAGLVIVAFAGNAVEHVVAIVLARRGHHDLAISVVKSSVAQIAAFLYPVLVLVSLALRTQLTFALAPVYIGALIGTAILIWQITGDGEATPFEGAALIATFVAVAMVAAYQV
jgi:Ca2+:H+ antiporter